VTAHPDPRLEYVLAIAAVLSLVAGVEALLAAAALSTANALAPEAAATQGLQPAEIDAITSAASWAVALAIGLAFRIHRRLAGGILPRRTQSYQLIAVTILLAPLLVDPVQAVAAGASGLAVVALSTAFGLWAVHRMQRYRRMPAWMTLAAFGWGATTAAGFAAITNGAFGLWAPQVLIGAGNLRVAQWFAASGLYLHAGVFEELAKGAGVAIAYVLLRRHIDGVVSGIVLGAAVGLGFNFTETVSYVAASTAPQFEYWMRQSVGLMASHTALSAVVGAGFGVARQLPTRRLRRAAISSGFLVAAGAHFASNMLNTVFAQAKQILFAPDPIVDALVLSPLTLVITQGPVVIMYVLLLRRGLRSQAAGLAIELPAEARTGFGAITDAEVPVLLNPGRRVRLAFAVLRRNGFDAYRNVKRLHAAQLNLGVQRWHRSRNDVDPWAPSDLQLRERVWKLKERQAACMTARPAYAEAVA
jgi:RsiW-degrading membrane proteinase PrsW (M82 family)